MREITVTQALEEAMIEEMERDERVITFGTVRAPALANKFGDRRVRFTPISEAAFTGIGLGAAGSGFRPVVNWGMVTFSFVAMDQIVNQASKIRYMFGGQADFPVTFRCTTGGGIQLAAQHSQSPYSMFMHLAGLKIILPSTPADAKGLLKSAIRDNNPTVFFECSRLAGVTGPVPDGDHTVPIGVADVKRAGRDVTVVGLAYYVREALAVADSLAKEGISIEVVDPRTLVPMDAEAIRASVRRTGRLVVVDEAPATCSAASEILALVTEDPETFRASFELASDWMDAQLEASRVSPERAVLGGNHQVLGHARRPTRPASAGQSHRFLVAGAGTGRTGAARQISGVEGARLRRHGRGVSRRGPKPETAGGAEGDAAEPRGQRIGPRAVPPRGPGRCGLSSRSYRHDL